MLRVIIPAIIVLPYYRSGPFMVLFEKCQIDARHSACEIAWH